MLSGYAQRGPAPNQEINAYGMRSRTVYPPNASPSAYGFDSGRAQATVALRQPNALRQNVPLLHPVIRPNDVELMTCDQTAEGLALPSGTPLLIEAEPVKAKTEDTDLYGVREKYNPDKVKGYMFGDRDMADYENKYNGREISSGDQQIVAFTMGKSPFTRNSENRLQGNIALVTRGPVEYRFTEQEKTKFIQEGLKEGDDIILANIGDKLIFQKLFFEIMERHDCYNFVARVTEAPQFQTGVLHIDILCNKAIDYSL